MIAVDTNILVYAHRRDSPWHQAADLHLTELAQGRVPWAIPWPCVHEFLAVVTNPRVFQTPSPLTKALDQVECWLESPVLHLLREAPGHWRSLKAALASGKVVGPMVHDARVHVLCRDHGVKTLWSADRDFSRFSGSRAENPLLTSSE